jgi:UDP-N-acetylmuramoyl-L-alanyl-D-glutamate--2,6-diaminopimelate ligase
MIFAALPGTTDDGMRYVADALKQGAAALLLPEGVESFGKLPVLLAKEPRQALSLIAARFFGTQPPTVAAVTGTNGKTSVASFTRQIWEHAGLQAASLGTVGIVTATETRPVQHTTPDPVALHEQLSELADEGVTHLALEASSHGLAQYRLDGVRLAAGAFTNITRDHLDYHGTFEAYLRAKMRLFAELLQPGQPAVIDADGDGGLTVAEAARGWKLDVMTVGEAGDAIRLTGMERDGFRQRISLKHGNREYRVLLPLPGRFQVSNALVSAGLAVALGTPAETAFAALEMLTGARGRLEYVGETPEGAPVFVDYAHTPDALEKALAALRPYTTGKLHVVFGCGGDRDPGKRPLMGQAASRNADAVYITDDNPRSEDPGAIRKAAMAGAPEAVEIAGRANAIAEAVFNLRQGDVLLVAGKGHETGQTINGVTMPFSDHDAVASALHARASQPRRAARA